MIKRRYLPNFGYDEWRPVSLNCMEGDGDGEGEGTGSSGEGAADASGGFADGYDGYGGNADSYGSGNQGESDDGYGGIGYGTADSGYSTDSGGYSNDGYDGFGGGYTGSQSSSEGGYDTQGGYDADGYSTGGPGGFDASGFTGFDGSGGYDASGFTGFDGSSGYDASGFTGFDGSPGYDASGFTGFDGYDNTGYDNSNGYDSSLAGWDSPSGGFYGAGDQSLSGWDNDGGLGGLGGAGLGLSGLAAGTGIFDNSPEAQAAINAYNAAYADQYDSLGLGLGGRDTAESKGSTLGMQGIDALLGHTAPSFYALGAEGERGQTDPDEAPAISNTPEEEAQARADNEAHARGEPISLMDDEVVVVAPTNTGPGISFVGTPGAPAFSPGLSAQALAAAPTYAASVAQAYMNDSPFTGTVANSGQIGTAGFGAPGGSVTSLGRGGANNNFGEPASVGPGSLSGSLTGFQGALQTQNNAPPAMNITMATPEQQAMLGAMYPSTPAPAPQEQPAPPPAPPPSPAENVAQAFNGGQLGGTPGGSPGGWVGPAAGGRDAGNAPAVGDNAWTGPPGRAEGDAPIAGPLGSNLDSMGQLSPDDPRSGQVLDPAKDGNLLNLYPGVITPESLMFGPDNPERQAQGNPSKSLLDMLSIAALAMPDAVTAFMEAQQGKAPPTGLPTYSLSNRDDKIPASLRYNNPGAAWPRGDDLDTRYGMTDIGRLNDGRNNGKGNLIAGFPSPIHGLAYNIAIAKDWGVGKTVSQFLGRWTQNQRHSAPGYSPNEIVTEDMLNEPGFWEAMTKAESGKAGVPSKEQIKEAIDMVKAGSAAAYEAANPGSRAAQIASAARGEPLSGRGIAQLEGTQLATIGPPSGASTVANMGPPPAPEDRSAREVAPEVAPPAMPTAPVAPKSAPNVNWNTQTLGVNPGVLAPPTGLPGIPTAPYMPNEVPALLSPAPPAVPHGPLELTSSPGDKGKDAVTTPATSSAGVTDPTQVTALPPAMPGRGTGRFERGVDHFPGVMPGVPGMPGDRGVSKFAPGALEALLGPSITAAGRGLQALPGILSQLLNPPFDPMVDNFNDSPAHDFAGPTNNPGLPAGDPGGLQGATPSAGPLSIDDPVEVTAPAPTVADTPAPDSTPSTQDAPSVEDAPGILAALAAENIDGSSALLLSVLASARKDDDMALLAAAIKLADATGIKIEEALQLIAQQSQGSEMHA